MKREYCYLLLTCDASEQERIARVLLEERLVNCVKFMPLKAMYWWKGKIEKADEVLLLMESASDLFDRVEAKVAEIHSYETFVLQRVGIDAMNDAAAQWIDGELRTVDA